MILGSYSNFQLFSIFVRKKGVHHVVLLWESCQYAFWPKTFGVDLAKLYLFIPMLMWLIKWRVIPTRILKMSRCTAEWIWPIFHFGSIFKEFFQKSKWNHKIHFNSTKSENRSGTTTKRSKTIKQTNQNWPKMVSSDPAGLYGHCRSLVDDDDDVMAPPINLIPK